MKILEKRNPLEGWSAEVECTGKNWSQNGKVPCGSKLEVDSNDIIKRRWAKYPDYKGVDYGFVCPVCKCFTEINKDKLPESMKFLAEEYRE